MQARALLGLVCVVSDFGASQPSLGVGSREHGRSCDSVDSNEGPGSASARRGRLGPAVPLREPVERLFGAAFISRQRKRYRSEGHPTVVWRPVASPATTTGTLGQFPLFRASSNRRMPVRHKNRPAFWAVSAVAIATQRARQSDSVVV